MSLDVFYLEQRVGNVTVSPSLTFTYDPGWLTHPLRFPVSVRLPMREEPHGVDQTGPWLVNLLPEDRQLEAMQRIFGVSASDVVGLLAKVGRDTAGALSFGLPGSTSDAEWRRIPNDDDLERIIDELPMKPFLSGEDGVSMSLAGVQSKLAVAVHDDGTLCVPTHASPSTHILKPDSDRLVGSVANEALCLTLASAIGLKACAVSTGRAGKRTYLLVERYDRLRDGTGWQRVHQEDFCQVLGLYPSRKYERNGADGAGPGAARMITASGGLGLAPAVNQMVDALAFNTIVGNTDAHAKNYAVVYGQGARSVYRLAPLYDVMCAGLWRGVTQDLAMEIGGQRRSRYVERRHWQRLADEAHLNPTLLVKRVTEMAELVLAHLDAAAAKVNAMPAGPDACVGALRDIVATNAETIIKGCAR